MRPNKILGTVAAVVLGVYAATAATAHAEPEPAPMPKATIDADGSYAVGTDILPGTYRSAGPIAESACYWKRTAGSAIVDNALSKKPQLVQIEPTDSSFVTNDCQPWEMTECPPECAVAPPATDVVGDVLGFLVPRMGGAPPSGLPEQVESAEAPEVPSGP